MKKEHLLDIGGTMFSINLDGFTDLISMDDNDYKGANIKKTKTYDRNGDLEETIVNEEEFERGPEINSAKYDLVRMCLEIVMTQNDEVDDKLGFVNAMSSAPISFKIAFNTLLEYDIITEI